MLQKCHISSPSKHWKMDEWQIAFYFNKLSCTTATGGLKSQQGFNIPHPACGM
jgi:hypothetical protein